MKLITEWKQAWKFFSVQANAIGTAVALTYATMYEQLKETLDPRVMMAVVAVVFVLGVVGRVHQQEIK